jgi:hypothetical protein
MAEYQMFRAGLLSIVLTLALGQNATLFCKVWCPEATSTGCPHQDSTTSPSVRADDNCTTVVVRAVTFVREDGRHAARASDSQKALIARGFQIAQAPTDLWFSGDSGRLRLLEHRPLIVALRI